VQDWLPYHQEYVDNFLALDGLGSLSEPPVCAGCGIHEADIKCQDCFGSTMTCSRCILDTHHRLPLHRLLVSKSHIHPDITLFNHNLDLAVERLLFQQGYFAESQRRIHLGHQGSPCPYAGPVTRDFTVVDVSGIHIINIRFCRCVGVQHPRNQLLTACWFPVTLNRPQTAFTFDLLATFQLINLQGKTSAYDFYYSLDHKTDNTGIRHTPVCSSLTVVFERLTFLT
jgi:CxC2 like cysteine cluster associated with KDZ transposases